jgi:hypothetical protein
MAVNTRCRCVLRTSPRYGLSARRGCSVCAHRDCTLPARRKCALCTRQDSALLATLVLCNGVAPSTRSEPCPPCIAAQTSHANSAQRHRAVRGQACRLTCLPRPSTSDSYVPGSGTAALGSAPSRGRSPAGYLVAAQQIDRSARPADACFAVRLVPIMLPPLVQAGIDEPSWFPPRVGLVDVELPAVKDLCRRNSIVVDGALRFLVRVRRRDEIIFGWSRMRRRVW